MTRVCPVCDVAILDPAGRCAKCGNDGRPLSPREVEAARSRADARNCAVLCVAISVVVALGYLAWFVWRCFR